MAVITHKQLTAIRKKHRGKKIVYVSGSYDLTHANHAGFLEQAKKQGDYLVVGVGPDYDIGKNKGGGRPILNQAVRLKMVDSIKSVDYSFIGKKMFKNGLTQSRNIEVFKKLRPDVNYVNNDASEMDFRKHICRQLGVKLVIAPPYKKFRNLSTTEIIEKVKKSS